MHHSNWLLPSDFPGLRKFLRAAIATSDASDNVNSRKRNMKRTSSSISAASTLLIIEMISAALNCDWA